MSVEPRFEQTAIRTDLGAIFVVRIRGRTRDKASRVTGILANLGAG